MNEVVVEYIFNYKKEELYKTNSPRERRNLNVRMRKRNHFTFRVFLVNV